MSVSLPFRGLGTRPGAYHPPPNDAVLRSAVCSFLSTADLNIVTRKVVTSYLEKRFDQ